MGGREVAELAGVALADVIRKLGEEGQAGRGDADHNGAAIVGRPGAVDELALVELVEQAGDVGGA